MGDQKFVKTFGNVQIMSHTAFRKELKAAAAGAEVPWAAAAGSIRRGYQVAQRCLLLTVFALCGRKQPMASCNRESPEEDGESEDAQAHRQIDAMPPAEHPISTGGHQEQKRNFLMPKGVDAK